MSLIEQDFDRKKHIYHDEDLAELLQKAVQFFNGTPVLQLPLKEKFEGSGIYAIYYIILNSYAFNRIICRMWGGGKGTGTRRVQAFSSFGD